MARCPLCSTRSAKRFCPAKQTMICTVCCGTMREVEIDCPSSCLHLKASRSYSSEKDPPDPQVAAQLQAFGNTFVRRFSPILDKLCRGIVEEHFSSAALVDLDVIETLKALSSSMQTLTSGIYYEKLPESSLQAALFRRLKGVLDPLLEEQALRVPEAVGILDFLTLAAALHSNTRPKTRQYLDWLTEVSGMAPADVQDAQESRLVLP